MFGIGEMRRELCALRREVTELRERLAVVEANAGPIRVGPFPSYWQWHSGDPRPAISIHSAIDGIIAATGLELKTIKARSANVFVDKAEKKK